MSGLAGRGQEEEGSALMQVGREGDDHDAVPGGEGGWGGGAVRLKGLRTAAERMYAGDTCARVGEGCGEGERKGEQGAGSSATMPYPYLLTPSQSGSHHGPQPVGPVHA